MKILIIQPDIFVYGGAERQIVELANYLTKKGHQITILSSRVIPEFRRGLNEARFLEVGSTENLGSAVKQFVYRFDVINPHNHPAELMSIPCKVKSVWQCNEPPLEVLQGKTLDPKQVEAVNKYIDEVFVISDFDKERYKKVYGKDPILNYPGIRYDFFAKKIRPVDRLGLKDSFVIIETGYVTWTKNQLKAVEILSEIKKDIPNAKLVIAGWSNDPYIEKVMNRAGELGLGKDVIFTGWIQKDEEIRDLYNLANVQILPVKDQGGWAVAFESICAGLPTIVSDTFIGSSIVKKQDLGFVGKMEEFPDLIRAVNENNFKIRENVGNKKTWIKDNLSWEGFGKKYEEILNKVVEG